LYGQSISLNSALAGSIGGEQIEALLTGYRVTLNRLRRVFFQGDGKHPD
jgi:hypothetical protein